jgi:hypothetical protein
LSSREKKILEEIPERLHGERVSPSAESTNAAIDSWLKYDKIYVGLSGVTDKM